MDKLNSRSLALALAAGYLVVSALIGTALVTAQKEDEALPYDPYPTTTEYPSYETATWTTTTRRTTTTTTTTTTAPNGYQQVSGAYQLVTVIPEGWTTRTGDVSTVQIARSSSYPGVDLRFGGAPPETHLGDSLFQRIFTVHQGKLGKNSYSAEVLRNTTLRGYPAVEWTYTTAPNGTAQFCTGTWWEADGIEYVLLVVAPISDRAQAEKMLDLMTTHAKP